MGWKNSPPVFSTATETLTDLANQGIHYPLEPKAHQLNDQAEAASLQEVGNMPAMSSSSNTTPIPAALDPSLSEMHEPLSYIDEFVDDSVGLAQTRSTAWWVPKIPLHAINDMFHPLDPDDGFLQCKPVSIQKL